MSDNNNSSRIVIPETYAITSFSLRQWEERLQAARAKQHDAHVLKRSLSRVKYTSYVASLFKSEARYDMVSHFIDRVYEDDYKPSVAGGRAADDTTPLSELRVRDTVPYMYDGTHIIFSDGFANFICDAVGEVVSHDDGMPDNLRVLSSVRVAIAREKHRDGVIKYLTDSLPRGIHVRVFWDSEAPNVGCDWTQYVEDMHFVDVHPDPCGARAMEAWLAEHPTGSAAQYFWHRYKALHDEAVASGKDMLQFRTRSGLVKIMSKILCDFIAAQVKGFHHAADDEPQEQPRDDADAVSIADSYAPHAAAAAAPSTADDDDIVSDHFAVVLASGTVGRKRRRQQQQQQQQRGEDDHMDSPASPPLSPPSFPFMRRAYDDDDDDDIVEEEVRSKMQKKAK
jgi:hypothetical protein